MYRNLIKYFLHTTAWKCGRFLFFTALTASCIPEPLEVKNIPSMDPKIVVNTQIVPDKHLVIWLTQTFGALEADRDSDPEELIQQISINDALVTLTGSGGTDTLSYLDYGVYGGINLPIKRRETLELRVQSPVLGEVYATTTVQDQVKFETLEVYYYYDFYDVLHAQVNFSVPDPPEKNWYLINAHKLRTKTDDVFRHSINPQTFSMIIDDADFDNLSNYENKFKFPVEDYEPGDSIVVSLTNISEEYYHFVKKRLDKRASFLDFLGEPANYPTNVVGGKGFFNLFIPDIWIIGVEENEVKQ